MNLTDHITDEQLNEYLDHETNGRAQIEMHLSTCADCAARLNALQGLFDEIESLADVALSPEFSEAASWGTVRFAPNRSASPQPLRSLTLTVTLQAVLTAVAIIVAAPFITPIISPYMSSLPAPSLTEIFLQLQIEWAAWLDTLSKLQVPAIPEIPVLELSSLFIMSTILGASLLWLIGNGLLLRNQMK
jgi:anti-sigma factor RsiW